MEECLKNCLCCGKEFSSTNIHGIFCSRNCSAKYARNNKNRVYEKICKYCGIPFISKTYVKEFCSNECKRTYYIKNPIKHEYELICNNCGKVFIKILANKPRNDENHYCSQECVGLCKNRVGTGIQYSCKYCGEIFYQKHKRHFFCSEDCKVLYGTKNALKKNVECSFCGKIIERLRHLKNKNFFCSRECESKFREDKANDIRVCEFCGNTFDCKKGDKLIFCSYECQGKWQSETRIGKNSSGWKSEITDDMRVKSCEFCGKDMMGTPKSFEINKFCSMSCKIKANKKSLTHPHMLICDYLETNDIPNEIEYQIKRFSLDNFLTNKSLGIEINGTYWHCDIRFYKNPVNDEQRSGILRDKRKKKLMIEKNIPVLYLWEYDIENNFDVCKILINKFIENNGILENYHSMNYELNGNSLFLIDNLFIPYAENDYILPLTTGTREIHFDGCGTV